MKLFLSLVLLTGILCAEAQNTKQDAEVNKVYEEQDSLPREVFLDSIVLKKLEMRGGRNLQFWFGFNEDNKYMELYDIRLKFDGNREAKKFHRKYWKQNSEGGPEVKDHSIAVKGAEELRVFYGTFNEEIKIAKLQVICILFVTENYFVKLFVTCDTGYSPDKLSYLVEGAVKKLKQL